nr:uncharacterized protein LOC113709989 [Coffea arabica]
MEVQISQITNSINNSSCGELSSKIKVNPREHVNVFTLRSGKMVEEPNFGNSSGEKDEEANEGLKGSQNDHVVIDIDVPPSNINFNTVPLSHRLKKDEKDRKFEKFVKIFKQLHINILFVDAITQISSYAHFLKDIISEKRKITDNEIIALTEECSALIKIKLPSKLKDLRSFSIPCIAFL